MLPSHKQGVTYLEHCRIAVSDERLCFVRESDAVEKFWSIPYAAICCLLLGPGTSLTHQAAKFLAMENVMVGFVGGGGSPLYFSSQSEYRPSSYLQDWCSFWFEPEKRLRVAQFFMLRRAEMVARSYPKIIETGTELQSRIDNFVISAKKASTPEQLLGIEAAFAKGLYGFWAKQSQTQFTRKPKAKDSANRFLDNGNYLAYGLAAAVLWILGIPHGLPVLHGNTRRGALVFDLADVIKDSCIMPSAFLGAAEGDDDSANRARCLAALDRFKALDTLFATLKEGIDVGCGRR